MTSFKGLILMAAIATGVAAAAPASAIVLTTSPVWMDDSASVGTYTQCNLTNTSTTPLSATSKVELLNESGTVQSSGTLAGLAPGALYTLVDSGPAGFRWCRITVASAKKVRGNAVVYFYDGTRYLTFAHSIAR